MKISPFKVICFHYGTKRPVPQEKFYKKEDMNVINMKQTVERAKASGINIS